jgi:tRNA (guanine-N7-)-methyltransferase
MLAAAARRPDIGVIGCEPFMNGVAAFMAAWAASGVDNVRVLPDDARFLLELLPRECLDRAYLLYPDPWPKRRHAARRFVNPVNLDLLAPRMRPGAELRIATDVAAYADHARAILAARDDFAPLRDAPDPWPHWPGTRYEAKARAAGRRSVYLQYRRL